MSTPDQAVADKIGRAIDGQILQLQAERAVLVGAAARIAEIDAEVAVLQNEKTRIDARRPPPTAGGTRLTPGAVPAKVTP